MSATFRLLCAALLLGSAGVAAPLAAFEPRPLSDAERGAVELVLAFAERGPTAIWDRLADDAPLRALGREAALAEITARLGAREGASWSLETPSLDLGSGAALFAIEFGSGVDDQVRFEMVERRGWRVHDLWTLVDRPPPVPRRLRGSEPARSAPRPPPLVPRPALRTLALGALALGAWRAARRARRAWATAAVGVLALLACDRAPAPSPPRARPAPPFTQLRLGALAPLRLALSSGERSPSEAAGSPAPAAVARVAELWRAQLRFAGGDFAGGEALLGAVAKPDDPVLATLLRARAAALRLRGAEAREAYEEVALAGFDGDALRLEQLGVARVTEEVGEASALGLLALGSRRAEPWYQAAAEAVVDDQDDLAESALRTGWQLAPAPRDEIFAEPALAALAARPALFPLFELGSPTEPRVMPRGARAPMTLPAGAEARLCGDLFTVEVGSFELELPGGAALAPETTRVEDAASWRQRAESVALAALAAPGAGAVAPGEATSPRRLRLAQRAARALARDSRWSELHALAGPLVEQVGRSAPELLVRLDALALFRLERGPEATTALAGLAARQLDARRPAPGTLYDLAELLARDGRFETAIRLIQKADAQLGKPHGERRLRQLELSRDLAASARESRSRHFRVRYPATTGDRYGGQVTTVLEEERRRLLSWIPAPGDATVEVELLPLQQFLSAYGGNVEVVGVYDGRLRMPFADLRSLDPRLIAIVSHELAHALLTGATRGQAPRWFQEGLAQHVEMGSVAVNPLPALEASGRTLAFPALEPILDGFSEPQLVELAYSEAAWAVAYLEHRWGVDGIRRLVRAFAAGVSTERALAGLGGGSLEEFDAAFRAWGARQAPPSRRREPRRFDRELNRPFAVETGEAHAGRLAAAAVAVGAQPGSRPPSEAELAAMRDWHQRYREATGPVRRAYAPIARVFGSGGGEPTPEQCATLRAAAQELLTVHADDLGAPDLELANQLRRIYQNLGDLATSCEEGRAVQAMAFYERIGTGLGRAAALLAPYGLQP